jgi:hypothetical protein
MLTILIFTACFAHGNEFTGLQTGNAWKYYQIFEWGGIWNGYPASPPNFRRYYRMMTMEDGFMQSDTQYWFISVRDSGRYRDGLTWKNFSSTFNDTCYMVDGKVFSSLSINFGWTLYNLTDTTLTVERDTINGDAIMRVVRRSGSITDRYACRQGMGLLNRYKYKSGSYRYWDDITLLEFNGMPVDSNGNLIGIEDGPINRPAVICLKQNHPNPFGSMTAIPFNVPSGLNVQTLVVLGIYGMDGRLIQTLFSGRKPPGLHSLFWDGRNGGGHAVAPGAYLYRLRIGNEWIDTKIMFLNK